MSKRSLLSLIGAGILIVAAVALGFSGAFARYLEMLTGDQAFSAKPLDALEITQQWVKVDDAYVLTFTGGEQAKNCRIYLAVSEGITNADSLQVELQLPAAETTDPEQPESPQVQTLTAVASPIEEGSSIYNLFGSGTVFQYLDAQTQEEWVFDLSQDPYVITVRGLDSAAELTSLIRLFVEFVP